MREPLRSLSNQRPSRNSNRNRKVVNNVQNEIDEDGDNDSPITKSKSTLSEQLLSAVENTSTSPLPIIELFISDSKKEDDLKKELLNIIHNDLKKSQARRLFDGLSTILESIVRRRGFLPASVHTSNILENEANHMQEHEQNRKMPNGYQSPDPMRKQDFLETIPDEASTSCLFYMQICNDILQSYLSGIIKRRSDNSRKSTSSKKGTRKPAAIDIEYKILDEAFQLIEILHDCLLMLQNCGLEGIKTQNNIMQSCELWWDGNIQYRNLITTQWIPLLVSRTLGSSAKQVDLKKLLKVKETLLLLDYTDNNSSYIKMLLLQTVSSSLYHKYTEGRKLIVFFFQLHPLMVPQLHQSIRAQIPNAKKSVLQVYAQIFFKSWKEAHKNQSTISDSTLNKENEDSDQDDIDEENLASRNIQSSIEETVLQDLMYSSIYLSSTTMLKSVHVILTPFFKEQQNRSVELLLYRMYTPIIWRALNATNASIRINALTVLSKVFPLRNPEYNESHTSMALDKCMQTFTLLLKDKDPKVRGKACETVVSVLELFWDAISIENIRSVLQIIVTQHASDVSSSFVRKTAITSITNLLSAQCSHAVLRAILPSLGNLIHDKIEQVRLAVVKMLLKIKKLKGIKYYHVVPLDHLLVRLVAEQSQSQSGNNAVVSGVTDLLLNSYFPQGPNATGSLQIERTLRFLASDPDAAIVFYKNISNHLSVNSVSKLVAMLFKCLCASVDAAKKEHEKLEQSKRKRRKKSSIPTSDSQIEINQNVLTASNISLMEAIVKTICILLESIWCSLSHECNQSSHDFLVDAFSGVLIADIHQYFENKAIQLIDSSEQEDIQRGEQCLAISSELLRCAGWMPPKAMESLVQHITEKLLHLGGNETNSESFSNASTYVALLCIWGKQDEVSLLLARSFVSVFTKDFQNFDNETTDFMDIQKSALIDDSQRTRGRKRKQNDLRNNLGSVILPAECAFKIILDILGGIDSACTAARETIIASDNAYNVMKKSLKLGMEQSDFILNKSISDDLISVKEIISMLISCEVYGRLIVHKQAMKGILKVEDEFEIFLSWVTETIVPLLLRRNGMDDLPNPDLDLSLSRISTPNDMVSPENPRLSHSMMVTKMKDTAILSNGKNSVERKASKSRYHSFESAMNRLSISQIHEKVDEMIFNSNAASISIIKNAMLVLSEWFTVGGSDSNKIAGHVVKWCSVLYIENDDVNIREIVFPAFSRVALELMKGCVNFSVFKEMMLSCKNLEASSNETKMMTKLIQTTLKFHPSIIEMMVETVFDVSKLLNKKTGILLKENFILQSLFENRDCSIELMKYLTKCLNTYNKDDDILDEYKFDIECLQALYENGAPNTNEQKVRAIIGNIQAELFQGTSFENILQDMINTIS